MTTALPTHTIVIPPLSSASDVRSGEHFARGNTDYEYKLEDYFEVELRADAPGSCREWETQMREAWDETVEITKLAAAGTEMLLESKPAESREEAYDEWVRVEQIFRALFGKYDAKVEGKTLASIVLNRLQELLAIHLQARKRVYLRCGADYVRYIASDSTDPRDIGTSAEGKYTIAKPSQAHVACPNGAWVADGIPQEDSVLECEPHKVSSGNKPQSRWCLPMFNAQTTRPPHTALVMFCPRILGDDKWSLNSVEPTGRSAAAFNFMATGWLHEIGHYGLGWIDEPAVDDKGKKLPLLNGHNENTYGWCLATNLAQHDPTRAIKSPENFSHFATAVYFGNWYWGGGIAKEKPEKDDFDPIKAYQQHVQKAVEWPSSGSDDASSDWPDSPSHGSPAVSSGDELYE
ncbi:Putative metallopeptidase, catalytic domain superfamily [Septoria linicola]|uniref:Metallopeptidase, catalytic domain superfamily n=1 Tax=Septoria linicola TaxID=215465 RepID=A0A9Q9B5V1_9PEZI|nr:putative metallopeptidase, catalytic domain superfamily [Septoria linicola]USW56891.1 Putative metallopeptidase, catalytic domain superfamily [Septoria linicola]